MNSVLDYSRLRVIGRLCYATIWSDIFAYRALKCVFLGYPYAQKPYKLFYFDNQKVILSRDIVFK